MTYLQKTYIELRWGVCYYGGAVYLPWKGLRKMKKTVASLVVSSLLLTSAAAASEVKNVDFTVESKCVYAEKFSPYFCSSKLWEYLKDFNLPCLPETNIPETDKPETDKPETDIPETDIPETDVPETDVPEVDIPETEKPETNIPLPDVSVPDTETDTNIQSQDALAVEVLRLVNTERTKAGLSALTLDSALSSVAKNHSVDMKNNNYFSHTNLKGQSPFDRLKNAGISYKTAGENIAMGQKTAQSVVSGWMNSEGHRANILNSGFGKMGLGTAQTPSGGYYWTQIFTN